MPHSQRPWWWNCSRMGSLLCLILALGCLSGARAEETSPLLNNPGFEEGAEGWGLPPTYQVVDDVARTGRRSLRLVNRDPNQYLLAGQRLSLKPGMMYRFGAWVKTEGVQGRESGATLCVEWNGAQGYLGGSYPEGRKGDNDWFYVEGRTPPIPAEATEVTLCLYLRRGMTGTAWFDDVTLEEYYPPALDAQLLYPNYRGRLAADEPNPRVVIRAQLGTYLKDKLRLEQTTLVGDLRRGEKTLAQRRLRGLKPGRVDLTLPARGLAAGDYTARVRLLAPDGSSLGERQFTVTRLPADAPQPTVTIDRHNRTLVNGKPFFPLGWYFGPHPGDANYREHLDRIAASPFNTVMPYGINTGSVEGVRAYLDDLDRRNLKILYSIKDIYEGIGYYQESVLGFRGEEAMVRGIVTAFRDHPAILGWYLNDELPLEMRDRLEARNTLVQQLDPNHPTWAVLYQVGELFGYLGTADVLGTDPYPIPQRPVTMAGDWTRETVGVAAGLRPAWQVPQAFDWQCYNQDRPDEYRAPTLDEVRVMTYLCLIHGANGLIYYSYFDLQRDRLGFDRRWADMLVVGNEVKALFPALLSAAPAPKRVVRSDREGVQYSLRADDEGNTYVLMANPDAKASATVRVAVAPGTEARVLSYGRVQPLPGAPHARWRAVSLPPLGAATLILQARGQ